MSLDFSLYIDIDTGGKQLHRVYLYDGNYTHNVTPMWRKCFVYGALYNSDGNHAGAIIDCLRGGYELMQANPQEYLQLNPSNGFGDYQSALKFLGEVLAACEKHPKAIIEVQR